MDNSVTEESRRGKAKKTSQRQEKRNNLGGGEKEYTKKKRGLGRSTMKEPPKPAAGKRRKGKLEKKEGVFRRLK